MRPRDLVYLQIAPDIPVPTVPVLRLYERKAGKWAQRVSPVDKEVAKGSQPVNQGDSCDPDDRFGIVSDGKNRF